MEKPLHPFFCFVFASPHVSEVRETTTRFHEVGTTPCCMPPEGEPVYHPCLLIQWRARTKNATHDVFLHFLFWLRAQDRLAAGWPYGIKNAFRVCNF